MHHNRGPIPTPANGHQFTLVGNAVDGGSVETQFKWGIAVHNSHYGLIQDNVVYNYNGSAIATEDGSESFNVFDHNFVLRGMGEPNNAVSEARFAMGTEGVGFWFRGPNNYVRNNVAANYQNETVEAAYGFVYQFRMLGNVAVPNFKGADTSVAGQFTTRNGNNLPLLQFENNEAYGAMQGGFTYWWVGGAGSAALRDRAGKRHQGPQGVAHLQQVGLHLPGREGHVRRLADSGKHSASSHCCGDGVHFSDYSATAIVIRNSDIQGMGSGIDAPSSGIGPGPNLTVENSILRNWDNINVPTPSSVNGCWMGNMLTVVKNTQLQAPPGRSLNAIGMDRGIGGAIECLSKQVAVRVYGFQGNANDNFQIYHSNGSVMPRPPGSCTPTTRTGIDGLTCTIPPLGVTLPTATLTATPQTIAPGQSATLTWSTSNATSVSINQGIGAVATSGTRSVSPATTTTYTITATNGGRIGQRHRHGDGDAAADRHVHRVADQHRAWRGLHADVDDQRGDVGVDQSRHRERGHVGHPQRHAGGDHDLHADRDECGGLDHRDGDRHRGAAADGVAHRVAVDDWARTILHPHVGEHQRDGGVDQSGHRQRCDRRDPECLACCRRPRTP